ncbi:hypothetical protein [Streptomyces scopuliridis]|uniref:DNA polymerase III subunit beta family protein n=1 Tax=Streptomyces scopuliridis TaxID=452529 RepID=UPI00343088F5
MSVTINVHQLGRLIDKVRSHIGNEYIEVLHGIRLDVDTTHLYAVASDRYTLAASRYRLNHDDKNGESFARTIPAAWLKPLREWLDAQEGDLTVTIGAETGRLVFVTPRTEMRVPVTDTQGFPDWRSLLRGVAANIPTIYAFPIVDSTMLARWADAGDDLRVRVTTDLEAFMVFGKDFIGAHAPKRYTGAGPCEDETFEQALELWPSIFADSDEVADMDADMPVEEKPRYEAASTIPHMVEALLQQTLRSTSDLLGAPSKDAGAIASYATAGVNAWSAYRFLAALHQADPRLAAQTVAELSEELDAGDFSESAWDIAKAAGHDPQKWSDDYEAHLKKLAEKLATDAA